MVCGMHMSQQTILGAFERVLRGSLGRLECASRDVYFRRSPIRPLPIEFWVNAAAVCVKKGLMQIIGLLGDHSRFMFLC